MGLKLLKERKAWVILCSKGEACPVTRPLDTFDDLVARSPRVVGNSDSFVVRVWCMDFEAVDLC